LQTEDVIGAVVAVRYLRQNQPDVLAEFENVVQTVSLDQ
jgi:hypothetical protein